MPVAFDVSDSCSRDGLPRVMGMTFSSLCMRVSHCSSHIAHVTPRLASPESYSADQKAATALRPH